MIFSPYDNASCGDESIGFLVFAISLFPIILPSATIQPFNVGYMDKSAEASNGYTWMTATFQKVDGSGIKLSDLTIKESQLPTAIKLYLLSKNGATDVDSVSGKKLCFRYVHPARCTASNGWISGWYFDEGCGATDYKAGSKSERWANEYPIPYGTGMGIFRSTVDATLVFSGAVASSDQEIGACNANGYTWMGNVMPVTLKLSDLSIKESQLPTAIKLYLLSKNGATDVDAVTGKKLCFRFVHPARCTASNGWISGWYYDDGCGATDYKAGSKSERWANDFELSAGQGFGLFRSTVDATLVIPTPLN